jgi:hypothetical protein
VCHGRFHTIPAARRQRLNAKFVSGWFSRCVPAAET